MVCKPVSALECERVLGYNTNVFGVRPVEQYFPAAILMSISSYSDRENPRCLGFSPPSSAFSAPALSLLVSVYPSSFRVTRKREVDGTYIALQHSLIKGQALLGCHKFGNIE